MRQPLRTDLVDRDDVRTGRGDRRAAEAFARPHAMLGIGHPGIKELVHHHVLSDFAKSDRPWVLYLYGQIHMARSAALAPRPPADR